MAKKNKEIVMSPEVISNLGDREKPFLVWSKAVFRGPDTPWKPYRRYKTMKEALDCIDDLTSSWPGVEFDYCVDSTDPLDMREGSQPGDTLEEVEF